MPALGGVAEDGGPAARPQALEVGGHPGVQLAHIPVPQLGEQLLGRRPIQPVQPTQRQSELRRRDPAEIGVPAKAGPAQPPEELTAWQPKAPLPAAGQGIVGRDLQDAADVERHRPNRHQDGYRPEGSGNALA